MAWAVPTEDASTRSRFERRLYVRPRDRETLAQYAEYLFDQGDFESSLIIDDQALDAGCDECRVWIRKARCRSALCDRLSISSSTSNVPCNLSPLVPDPTYALLAQHRGMSEMAIPPQQPGLFLLDAPFAVPSAARREAARRLFVGAHADIVRAASVSEVMRHRPRTLLEVCNKLMFWGL
jgi:hypothetical protein